MPLPQARRVALDESFLTIANILIIRFDGIGDAAILAPLIAGLRAAGHRLDIVLSERSADVFAPGVFSTVFPLRWNAWKTRAIERNFADLLATLRARRYDWALIPTEELAAYRLAKAASIPRRRGFENGFEKPLKTLLVRALCTHTVHRPASLRHPSHEARVQYKLGEGLTAWPEPTRDIALLQPLFLERPPTRTDTVALQITRKWETIGVTREELTRMIRRLDAEVRLRCLAPRGESDFARGIAGTTLVDLFDDLPPWKTAIAQAGVLITPDTGAAHIAGMVGTPVIDGFPEKDFASQTLRWSPWAVRSRLIPIARNAPPGRHAQRVLEALHDLNT